MYWSHAITSMNIKSNMVIKLAVGKIWTHRMDQQTALFECFEKSIVHPSFLTLGHQYDMVIQFGLKIRDMLEIIIYMQYS